MGASRAAHASSSQKFAFCCRAESGTEDPVSKAVVGVAGAPEAVGVGDECQRPRMASGEEARVAVRAACEVCGTTAATAATKPPMFHPTSQPEGADVARSGQYRRLECASVALEAWRAKAAKKSKEDDCGGKSEVADA